MYHLLYLLSSISSSAKANSSAKTVDPKTSAVYNAYMKHILPVLAFALSLLCFAVSALCLLMFVLIGWFGAPVAVAAFAVPVLVTDCFTTALAAGTNFMFLKHKLCFAGFMVSLADICMIIVSFILMFAF